MNYYSFIPLTAFIINLFTFTYILAQKRESPVNRSYLVFSFFVALWMIGLFILWLPISEITIIPMEKITTTMGFIVGFCFLKFTYIFLERKKDYIYQLFLSVLVLSCIINI